MTVAPPPSQLQVAQRLAAHLGHRDFENFTELLSDDVTYRVDGNHALAGTFHGPDEVVAHMRQLVDRTDNTFDALKWEDWLVGELHVAAVVRIRLQEQGAVFSGRLILLFGFNPASKISEITVYFEDADGAERFFYSR
jgi:ketosteroid isomerase-like protein